MDHPQSPNPLAEGIAWASRITTISLGFVLPVLVGAYLDRWFGTKPVGALIGLGLGFVTGMVSVIGLTREPPRPPRDPG